MDKFQGEHGRVHPSLEIMRVDPDSGGLTPVLLEIVFSQKTQMLLLKYNFNLLQMFLTRF